MRPLRNLILINPEKMEKKSKGGIFIPDSVRKKHQAKKGKVIEIGEEVDPEVEVGDTVLFGKYAGFDIEHENKDYVLVEDKEVMARLV